MKSYTKYDFAAIVGAKVEFTAKSGEALSGTLILASNKTICLLQNENPFEGRWFAIEDITPGSLTAKIKVEDMTFKQLKMYFNFNWDVHLVLNAGEADTCRFDNGGINHLVGPVSVSTVVDCTNWGWTK